MPLPNFIIGGAAAAGTSFLSATLVQHQQIYLPTEMRPEPHYFYKPWEYENGPEYYQQRWFSEVKPQHLAIGERSSSYLYGGKAVAARIASLLPDIKLIFTLRNPIERTWANYRFTALNGLEDLPFMEAIVREKQRINSAIGQWQFIQPHDYTGRGLYGQQLQQWLNYFDKSQILCIKSESLSSNTALELKKICRFLQVNDNFKPVEVPAHTSMNIISAAEQFRIRQHFGSRFDRVMESFRTHTDAKQILQGKTDQKFFQMLENNLTGSKAAMPEDAQAYLKEYFAEDLALLSTLVDFEVSDWN